MVLTQEQADFIKNEFALSFPANKKNPMPEKLWALVKQGCFMVECEETDKSGPVSDRGRIAVSICDMKY